MENPENTLTANPAQRRIGGQSFWTSSLLVFIVLLFLGAIGRTGLEKQAFYTPHDDYYFLQRSQFYDLNSHLTFVKEYPYSFFIKVGRQLGFSLWDFELLFFSLALTALWVQLRRYLRCTWAAWMVVLPLPFFPMLNLVFQRATYDNLQIILTPLTFATALAIINSRAGWLAIAAAGAVGGLHLATRPEGILFFLPLAVALAVAGWCCGRAGPVADCPGRPAIGLAGWAGRAALLLCSAAFLPLSISLHNGYHHGFRAQTIMKAKPMQETLRLLMEIQPEKPGGRYSPVPMDSLAQALAVSPALQRARPHFDANTGGRGWSAGSVPAFRPTDGSISGGHFQWAWQEFSSLVAGIEAAAILAYQEEVAAELRAGFEDGRLKSRRVWTTAFGPNFSLVDAAYWQSVWRLTRILLHWDQNVVPGRSFQTGVDSLENDYDRLALRKSGLIIQRQWTREGWVVQTDPLRGPARIRLDAEALSHGTQLETRNRPDVAVFILGHSPGGEAESYPFGFLLEGVATQLEGNLLVEFADATIAVPLQFLHGANPHRAWGYGGLTIHLEGGIGGAFTREARRNFNWMTDVRDIFYVAGRWGLMLLAGFFLLGLLPRRNRDGPDSTGGQLLVVSAMVILFVGAFVAVLAGIDAFMYPGDEPRYLAPVSFALWFWGAFVPVRLIRGLLPARAR